ncbi:MAG: hypothetical protein ACLQM6_07635 [Acidobacteriaceae bacterium]
MRKSTGIVAVVLIAVVVIWMGLYPDKYDPKNIHYVLWKWHLVSIDLDRAVSTMHHDQWSEKMILGKNERELTNRFGYLLTPDEASRCNRIASQGLVPAGDEALFLRSSNYLIIFHDGIATDVVLLNEASPC